MKKYIFLIFFLNINLYSQINGKWKIIKCYPEVTGFSKIEEKEFTNDCIGNFVSIDNDNLNYLGIHLQGKLDEKVSFYDIIDNSKVADSLNIYIRYFCQEISYFNAVTRQTINIIDKNYKQERIGVLRFKCMQDKKTTCCYIYIFNDDRICLCIPGDAFYYLKRI
jgi:hypothetical protein